MTKVKTLREFIDAFGVEKLSRKTGMTKASVYYWRTGERTPTPKNAKKLLKLGEPYGLSAEMIFRFKR